MIDLFIKVEHLMLVQIFLLLWRLHDLRLSGPLLDWNLEVSRQQTSSNFRQHCEVRINLTKDSWLERLLLWLDRLSLLLFLW